MTEEVRISNASPSLTQAVPKRAPVVHNEQASAENKRVAVEAAKDNSKAVEATNFSEDNTYLSITRGQTPFSFVYKAIDKETGNVIWRWPAAELKLALDRLRSLEKPDGHGIDEQA
jgi:hypothetical protein